MEDTRGWKIGSRETEKGKSLIRVKDIEEGFDFSAFPERLSVIWDFEETAPSANEFDAMKEFEDQVCERIESDGSAILCIVFTEPGYREWDFHATSAEAFVEVLNQLPPRDEPFPIEIHHATDPEGEFYWSFARRLRSA
jgi:hypothetical protein